MAIDHSECLGTLRMIHRIENIRDETIYGLFPGFAELLVQLDFRRELQSGVDAMTDVAD